MCNTVVVYLSRMQIRGCNLEFAIQRQSTEKTVKLSFKLLCICTVLLIGLLK